MTYTMTADRIIQMAQEMGYGLDIDFTGRKPISIKPLSGRAVKFQTLEAALHYLQGKRSALVIATKSW